MKVWIVEMQPADPYDSPYLLGIFATKELAELYVKKQPSYEQNDIQVSEVTVVDGITEHEAYRS